MVQLMLAGSKVSEMFWCVLVLLLLLDARNVLLMLVSASKLPMCVMQVVLLLPVSRLCSRMDQFFGNSCVTWRVVRIY